MSQILSESKRLRERKKENENVKRILLTAEYLLPSSKTHVRLAQVGFTICK